MKIAPIIFMAVLLPMQSFAGNELLEMCNWKRGELLENKHITKYSVYALNDAPVHKSPSIAVEIDSKWYSAFLDTSDVGSAKFGNSYNTMRLALLGKNVDICVGASDSIIGIRNSSDN